MPKQGLTEILMVVDKSGSMAGLESDVIGGFNRFLYDQEKVPGEARVTLTLFDSIWPIPMAYRSRPIRDVPTMTSDTYSPGGGTALLDAIGTTIVQAGRDFDARPEHDKPEKVVMVIVTDGYENSSREYTQAATRALIEQQQRDWNWQFVYLGANQDAFLVGQQLAVPAANTANYRPTGQSVRCAYSSISDSVASFRAGGSARLNNKEY